MGDVGGVKNLSNKGYTGSSAYQTIMTMVKPGEVVPYPSGDPNADKIFSNLSSALTDDKPNQGEYLQNLAKIALNEKYSPGVKKFAAYMYRKIKLSRDTDAIQTLAAAGQMTVDSSDSKVIGDEVDKIAGAITLDAHKCLIDFVKNCKDKNLKGAILKLLEAGARIVIASMVAKGFEIATAKVLQLGSKLFKLSEAGELSYMGELEECPLKLLKDVRAGSSQEIGASKIFQKNPSCLTPEEIPSGSVLEMRYGSGEIREYFLRKAYTCEF